MKQTKKRSSSSARVSGRKVLEIALWKNFIDLVAGSGPAKLPHILSSLLTGDERRAISLRAEIGAMLEQGATYREIGRRLWVTHQTISAVRKGMAETDYSSNWQRAVRQHRAKIQNRLWELDQKPWPKRSHRTKYGTIHIPA